MTNVSIVTTCKGRLSYLKRSLPSWLAQDCGPDIEYDIIVVDFGCPDRAADWCTSLGISRIRTLRAVNDVDIFNLARARNIGGRSSHAEFLAFVDADIELKPCFIRRHVGAMLARRCNIISDGVLAAGEQLTMSLCTVERAVFDSLRGFDESFKDYGHEDTDFYRRCDAHGWHREWWHVDAIIRVCSDDERTRFYANKNISESITLNAARMADAARPVNTGEWGQP